MAPEKRMLSVDDFLKEYSISRSTFYQHVKKGTLKIKKDGTRTLILREEAENWMHALATPEQQVPAS